MLKATAFSLPIKVENTIRGRGRSEELGERDYLMTKYVSRRGANLHNPSPFPTFFYFPLPPHAHTVAPSLLLEAALTTFGTVCHCLPVCTAMYSSHSNIIRKRRELAGAGCVGGVSTRALLNFGVDM